MGKIWAWFIAKLNDIGRGLMRSRSTEDRVDGVVEEHEQALGDIANSMGDVGAAKARMVLFLSRAEPGLAASVQTYTKSKAKYNKAKAAYDAEPTEKNKLIALAAQKVMNGHKEIVALRTASVNRFKGLLRDAENREVLNHQMLAAYAIKVEMTKAKGEEIKMIDATADMMDSMNSAQQKVHGLMGKAGSGDSLDRVEEDVTGRFGSAQAKSDALNTILQTQGAAVLGTADDLEDLSDTSSEDDEILAQARAAMDGNGQVSEKLTEVE